MKQIANPFQLSQPQVPWVRCPKCRSALHDTQWKPFERSFVDIHKAIENNKEPPENDEGVFTVSGSCANCHEILAAAGTWSIDVDFDDDGEMIRKRYYRPRWFSLSPALVSLPKRVPAKIVAELRRADQLFWVDLHACATALRRSVEALLTVARVPKHPPGKRANLHDRIEVFAAKDQLLRGDSMKVLLHAIREVGNEGTHGIVAVDDVAMMASWIERALELRYGAPDPVWKAATELHRRRTAKKDKSKK